MNKGENACNNYQHFIQLQRWIGSLKINCPTAAFTTQTPYVSTLPISYLTKMSSKGVFTTLPRVHSHGAFQIITRSHHESYFDLTCETSSLRYTSIVYPLRLYLSLPLRVDIFELQSLTFTTNYGLQSAKCVLPS